MREGRGDAGGVGVEQQLRGVEAVALLGRPRALGAQAVVRALRQARHEAEMHIAQPRRQRNARHFRFALEQRDEDARGMARDDRDIGAAGGERDAERKGRAAMRLRLR